MSIEKTQKRPTCNEQNANKGSSRTCSLAVALFLVVLLLAGCGLPAAPTPSPTATLWVIVVTATPTATVEPSPSPSALPGSLIPTQIPGPTSTAHANPDPRPTDTPPPTVSSTSVPTPAAIPIVMVQEQPGNGGHPTLADFWAGRARFVVEVADTGLPMGESDTIVTRNGELWSYLHASQRSAGTVDCYGRPAEFPGCTVIYRSYDSGRTFQHDDPPICLFECQQRPCDSKRDHIDQQQYPRVAYNGKTMVLVYEYRARVMLRRSTDGLNWSAPEELPGTGIWWFQRRECEPEERVGSHPYASPLCDCLVGGPPGVYVEGDRLYVFVGLGRNPGSMGCYYGAVDAPARTLRKCQHNPLFTGAVEYGLLSEKGPQANPYFDFRIISSADVQKVGDRYYMVYEGIRGPGPGDPGDTQFGLGLARSLTSQIDGPWEKFPGNPILVDLPGNIGLGHADLVVLDGQTLLYTSLDGVTRSRLALIWK